ncbi:MAG: UDP-N-acetylmuramoyl-L-alanine--D-glutamate ligase [Ignavibacteriales bacterium]|nr:UDP-N-acetylmuramoylalanine--D-glutamate ligase [Ignavibacteriaceae bacterium]MCZ2143111.1 UDP-N-acetylmuramoyl-L-alanine--D-glutamate ligase [Ignavibacteriales bacterium]WKZ72560.1 MAG: UDP-N-acetylmuramoyl-L-alanine--D-glutamate ligase [Ignavibacteriaceae bacterium]
MNIYENTKISIIGAARSGEAAAYLAQKLGAVPFVSDNGAPDKLHETAERLRAAGIGFEAGANSNAVFDCDVMVVSPGVPTEARVVQDAMDRGIKLISEIEFAASVCPANIFAVTGTNGKTTTTSLLYHIFKLTGKKAFTAGNIGLAFSDIVPECDAETLVALEVSSFQLDFIKKFKPKGAALLNITPDHLNRYGYNFENYVKSKYRIFMNQKEGDTSVYNFDDRVIREHGFKGGTIKYFSTRNEVEEGAYLSGEKIIAVSSGQKLFSFDVREMNLKGEHNYANAAAAVTLAVSAGVPADTIIEGLKTFQAVEHRLEPVPASDGIVYINDSKATNVDSVVYALKSFETPIYLILGGIDKGNNYDLIRDLVLKNVKKIYAIGESAEKIIEYFGGLLPVEHKNSLYDCVVSGHNEANPGEVVLLSPACASFDMFDNYEHRGKVFKAAVQEAAG